MQILVFVAAAVPGSLESNVLAVCLMKCSGKGFFPPSAAYLFLITKGNSAAKL